MALTSFFRDRDTLEVIADELAARVATQLFVRIWDAGCASGEEPYTLAMLFAEWMQPDAFATLRIDATDHEESDFPQFARSIAEGVFGTTDTMWVPRPYFEKYFEETSAPDKHRVVDRLRERITFTKNDLRALRPVGRNYDLVVCKNVILHIPEAERGAVACMFGRSLVMGGLAAFESTQPMPDEAAPYFEKVGSRGGVWRKVAELP
jgi:chemotaxis protein methyltransferase CheR